MKHLTQNKTVIDWIEEKIALVSPDTVMWIDGSEEQLDALRAEACKTGEMIKLNEDLLPGCLLHRTKPNDVARVENRTFICAESADQAGPTNNWMDPAEAYKMLYDRAKDSYKGRTMYVIPYSMGPVGSPFSKIGIELTDSIYVVLNMAIMTRIGKKVIDTLGDSNDWVRGTAAAISTPRSVISASSRRITPLSPSTPLTAETSCSARSALLCA